MMKYILIRSSALKTAALACAVSAGLGSAVAFSAPPADAAGARPAAADQPIEPWVAGQEQSSWRHLQENISPTEPKTPGGPLPLRGIVVAALSKKDPDYYFHWVRDSQSGMWVLRRSLAGFATGLVGWWIIPAAGRAAWPLLAEAHRQRLAEWQAKRERAQTALAALQG